MPMTTSLTSFRNGKATTEKTMFSRETSIAIDIQADPAIVWALLTNAADYPRWNSTVISIDGDIVTGKKIELKSTLDSKRTFTLTVKELIPEKKLVWGDGQGARTFTLVKQGHDGTRFSMREKIGGLMFPLYARYIPPFDKAFEQFASDLKKEAEMINNNKI
jgi:uncharacterized protein YndB with AHSA1/START domain